MSESPRHTFYLRIEGVNLANFIFDNQDLSTVRGGGLLLLDGVNDLQRFTLKSGETLEAISLGASIGLFNFSTPNPDRAKEIREELRDHFSQHHSLKHATFVIDVIAGSNFGLDRERLLARNRWRQMREPSVSLSHLFDSATANVAACEIDLVRPGIELDNKAPQRKRKQSAATRQRREYGLVQKKCLYKNETGLDLNFVETFEDLSKLPDTTAISGILHHKMAVIYFDGNDFGKLQSVLCGDEIRQRQWNLHIKNTRKTLLRSLLERASSDKTWREDERADGAIRLETLLWGGDELIWVVPAWKGFETLRLFTEQSKGWTIPDGLDPRKEHPFTHAGGVVFCSCKAPIHRMTKLAQQLAELAKDRSRRETWLGVEMLESFDHIGDDLSSYMNSRHPMGIAGTPRERSLRAQEMLLQGDQLHVVVEKISLLKSPRVDFPRRLHHRLVQNLVARKPTEHDEKELIAQLDRSAPGAWSELQSALGGGKLAWVQLWQFWDYVCGEMLHDSPRPQG